MEEEKREEKVEEVKDDFDDIKEMQKTQELKKVELGKEEVKEEEKISKKKGHPIFVTFLIIMLLAVFTCMGFFGGLYYYKNSLEKENKEEKRDSKENEEENTEDNKDSKSVDDSEKLKSSIPVTDKIIVNLYTEGKVYFINDGELYRYDADLMDGYRYFLLTHSGCLYDNSSSYCQLKGNVTYGRKPVKIEGVFNVSRIKLFNHPKASDESFILFVIDDVGNIYVVYNNNAIKLKTTDLVEDMFKGSSDKKIQLLLKDGTIKDFDENLI